MHPNCRYGHVPIRGDHLAQYNKWFPDAEEKIQLFKEQKFEETIQLRPDEQ